MRLTATEVNILKAAIEGSNLGNLYKRLKWGEPKSLRFSVEELDSVMGILLYCPTTEKILLCCKIYNKPIDDLRKIYEECFYDGWEALCDIAEWNKARELCSKGTG